MGITLSIPVREAKDQEEEKVVKERDSAEEGWMVPGQYCVYTQCV